MPPTEPTWTKAETALLYQLLLQAVPSGTYTTEPPLLFPLIAQRLRKAFLPTPRLYTPETCRAHYLTTIAPFLPHPPSPSASSSNHERPWSEAELYCLRTHLSAVLPGGLDSNSDSGRSGGGGDGDGDGDVPLQSSWHAVAECLVRDALVAGEPLRLYDAESVREVYVRRVAPRFVQAGQLGALLRLVAGGAEDGEEEVESGVHGGGNDGVCGTVVGAGAGGGVGMEAGSVVDQYLTLPNSGGGGKGASSSSAAAGGSVTSGSVSGEDSDNRPPPSALLGDGAGDGGRECEFRALERGAVGFSKGKRGKKM